jgi:CheY-like chemotaxis protein/anti-sigma regulatory factor (Ser/Thr protein kinase)
MGPATGDKPRVLVVDDDRALRHALASLLEEAGYDVRQAADGPQALASLKSDRHHMMLLDLGLPGMSGLDVLAELSSLPEPPRVAVITADDTPHTLLRAVRGQCYRYLTKPFAPNTIVEVVADVLAAPPLASLPIEVVSARPEWVEIVAPCTIAIVDRIEGFMMQLETNLPEAERESVAQAFRELLHNAIEWGGKLDPSRKVRISCLRARRMVLYRIADPGQGFDIEGLTHAAVCNPADDPLLHAVVREAKGIRPGGLGIAMTRELVDELIYNEARNEVVFIKYLS